MSTHVAAHLVLTRLKCPIMHFQLPFILDLQHMNGLAPLMKFFTFLGNEEFLLLLIPLVYLCFDKRLGARLGLLVLACDALCFLLKLAFHAPRPYWIDARVQALSPDTSYGFPSSHAQNAVALWFFLCVATQVKSWKWFAATTLIFLISLSRVYLGAHFPIDVIGGGIIGALFLLAFLRFEPVLEKRFATMPLNHQILAALGATIALFALGVMLRMLVASDLDPASWAAWTQGEARSLDALASRSGAIFGLCLGLALMSRRARFEVGGAWMNRVMRFVVGVLGLLLLKQGLGVIFPSQPEIPGLFFRFLRYALMTLWVVYLAPLLFLRIGLARRDVPLKNQAGAVSSAA